jgi:hypothetical protein
VGRSGNNRSLTTADLTVTHRIGRRETVGVTLPRKASGQRCRPPGVLHLLDAIRLFGVGCLPHRSRIHRTSTTGPTRQ